MTTKPFLALFSLLLLPVLGLTPARADLIKQSTAYTRSFLVTQSASPLAGATAAGGATVSPKIRKAGGTYVATTNAATEVDATNDPGRWQVVLTATETNMLGLLDLAISGTGINAESTHDQVFSADLSDVTTTVTQATGANTQASTLLLSLATYQSALTTGSTTTALNTALTGTADLTGGKVVFTAGVNKGVACHPRARLWPRVSRWN